MHFSIHTVGLLSWYQSCKRRHSAHWAQHTTAHEQCLSFIFLQDVDSHFFQYDIWNLNQILQNKMDSGHSSQGMVGEDSFHQNCVHFHNEPFILISVSPRKGISQILKLAKEWFDVNNEMLPILTNFTVCTVNLHVGMGKQWPTSWWNSNI